MRFTKQNGCGARKLGGGARKLGGGARKLVGGARKLVKLLKTQCVYYLLVGP